jgi:hypothetical protein
LVHGASMLRRDGDSAEPSVIRFSTEALRSGLSSPVDATVPRKPPIKGLNKGKARGGPTSNQTIENNRESGVGGLVAGACFRRYLVYPRLLFWCLGPQYSGCRRKILSDK